ncbi:MAG: tetratricopeptide repeat protein [Bacteroidia bacterium]
MEFRNNSPDTCIYFAQQALTLSEKVNFKKGRVEAYLWIGTAYTNKGDYENALKLLLIALKESTDKRNTGKINNNIGLIYYAQGNYAEALRAHFASLRIRKEIEDKQGIAASYNNIGNVYYSQGNYPEALRNHFASLKLKEQFGNKLGIASSYNNIGNVYFKQKNYSEARKNHFAALDISKEIGNEQGIADSYNNIGNAYADEGNYMEALKNHIVALEIKEKIGDKQRIAASYNNIGNIYYKQANYSEALNNHLTALEIETAIGDKEGVAASHIYIGNIYTAIGKADEGNVWLEKALRLSKQLGNKNCIKESYLGLSEADSALAYTATIPINRKWEHAMSALENYKMYVLYKDSLINEEIIKKTEREKNQYEFDKREVQAEAERKKKAAVAEAERRKQQVILWSVSGGLLLVVLFAGIVFRSLRITKKQKHIIEEQKFQIVESINYSKKIQESLLPSVESMQTALPGLFLFYEPKAIVSGDFYYFKEFENYILLACVDCTGHGVPGGFMSTLGSLLLDKLVNDELHTPSEILNKLSNEIIRVLHQQDGGEIQDGMDLSVCLIDKSNKKIEFSGARNGIIIVSGNGVKRYKASSLPVGGNYMKKGVPIVRNFQTESIAVNPGDWIYMYTDGFMEQRGDKDGTPMTFTQFENRLVNLSTNKTPEEKRHYLLTELNNWRRHNERDDDVLIIGFQVY